MPADTTTFYLAFTAVFAGIGIYLLRLDRYLRTLETRIDIMEGNQSDADGARQQTTKGAA